MVWILVFLPDTIFSIMQNMTAKTRGTESFQDVLIECPMCWPKTSWKQRKSLLPKNPCHLPKPIVFGQIITE